VPRHSPCFCFLFHDQSKDGINRNQNEEKPIEADPVQEEDADWVDFTVNREATG